jgi:hypothetical protein
MELSNLGAIAAASTLVVSLVVFLIALVHRRGDSRRDRFIDALAAGAIAAGGFLTTLLVGRALVLVVQGLLRSLAGR